ncbi:hypothetical protein EV715DRAFT_268339, partial [Schizophyllum commune]
VAKNPEHHGRMKHLDLRFYWLRDEDENSYIYCRDPGKVVPPNAPHPGHYWYIVPVEIKVVLSLPADWLLAWALEFWDYSEHACIFSIHKWRKFCRKVRAKRRTTESLGIGLFRQTEAEDEGPIADDACYLARYGADQFYWESKLAEHCMWLERHPEVEVLSSNPGQVTFVSQHGVPTNWPPLDLHFMKVSVLAYISLNKPLEYFD